MEYFRFHELGESGKLAAESMKCKFTKGLWITDDHGPLIQCNREFGNRKKGGETTFNIANREVMKCEKEISTIESQRDLDRGSGKCSF
jgi:hypothetical protein